MVERSQHSPRIQRHCTAFRSYGSTRFGPWFPPISDFPEKAETFRPESLETLLRIQWKLISGTPGNFPPKSALAAAELLGEAQNLLLEHMMRVLVVRST
jgi:hypothetical protein